MIQGSANENDLLKCYNLNYCEQNMHKINKTNVVGHATCKILYCKRILLLSGQSDDTAAVWKLRLYYLDTTKLPATWKHISRFSSLRLDLKNSISVSNENGDIILVSVLQHQEKRQLALTPVIYMLPQSRGTDKSTEKYWKAVKLRQSYVNCEIHSSVVTLNHIYFSLFQYKTGAWIIKCGLQKPKETNFIETISSESSWQVKDVNMQNCFLSMYKEKVHMIIISLNVDGDRTIMEIKELRIQEAGSQVVSPAKYQYTFPCTVKVFAASIVPDVQNLEIATVYHDNKINACRIRRISPDQLL